MIVLDICGIALVLIGLGIYREVRQGGKVARIHYKIQGLRRFE